MRLTRQLARGLLYWPAVLLIRGAGALVSLCETSVGRWTVRPAFRVFCRFVLYARPLRMLRDETQHVLPERDLPGLFGTQKVIAVIPCSCRAGRTECNHAAHGLHESDACIALGGAALLQLGSGLGDRLTAAQALALCRRCREAGMVQHGLYSFGSLAEVCNCCAETCGVIRAYCSGVPEAVRPSGLVAERASECDGCADREGRLCEDICPYGLSPGNAGCFGCGLCAERCPNEAVQMAAC